jgi:hypothetical protein
VNAARMARRFEESGLNHDQATGIAEAISDEISASLPSKADVDLAIERVKGELLQAIHAAERRLADQMSGYVKWFVGIMFLQTGILASLIGWFVS